MTQPVGDDSGTGEAGRRHRHLGVELQPVAADFRNFDQGRNTRARIGKAPASNTVFGKTPLYTVPGYTMLNLYFDYTFPNNQLDASLSVTNLTNDAAILSRFTNQYGGETTQQYAPPREFIARVAYRF